MRGAKNRHSSLYVNMNDKAALAKFEAESHGIEPVNGIVQPVVIPPEDKPHRNTDALQYVLKRVIKEISMCELASPFMIPVDAVKLDLPDYHSIIKYPIDVGTIQKRLQNCYYYDVNECIKDFQMMFYNCYKYNNADDDIVYMAEVIENAFVREMRLCPEKENEIPMDTKSAPEKAKGRKRKVADAVLNSKLPSVAGGAKNCVSTTSSLQTAPLPPPISYSSPEDICHHFSHTRAATEKLKTTNRTPVPVVMSRITKGKKGVKRKSELISSLHSPVKDVTPESSGNSSSDYEKENHEKDQIFQKLMEDLKKIEEEIKIFPRPSTDSRDKKKQKLKENKCNRT